MPSTFRAKRSYSKFACNGLGPSSVEQSEMYEIAARTVFDDPTSMMYGIPVGEIRSELDLILRSRAFAQSHRIRRFLEFVVEEHLLGQPQRLKEYVIGLEVFDRREAFDPRVDSIVRVEARRLRNKLEEYYRSEGREDPVRILLRKGSYIPFFEYRSASTNGVTPVQKRSLEIAPFSFVNPGPNAETLAEEIQRRLTHVFIKEGCFQVVVKPQTPQETSAENTPADVAHPSQTDYVVEGSLQFHDSLFHLIVQVMQPGEGSYVWSEATDGQAEDLVCVEELGKTLVHELISSPNEAASARRTQHKESRDLYLQGRYNWKLGTPDSVRNSISCFAQAVEYDENYAAAWAALSEALLVSSMFGLLSATEGAGRIKDAATKAISLNAQLPEAHVALGSALSIYEPDWTAGEQEIEKAVQLDRHEPAGHIAYGIHLACRGMLEAANVELERALEMDPAALFPNFVLGWLYCVSRRFDEAISQHLLVSQLAPDYGLPHLGLGLAYAAKGMFPDAIAHFTNASQMKCQSLLGGQLGYCYAKMGQRDAALREIANLKARRESEYVSSVSFATVYAGLGDAEAALSYLQQAAEERDASLPLQLLNPEFDLLRADARFQTIRQRIGLPAA